jgi:hypothetical protein
MTARILMLTSFSLPFRPTSENWKVLPPSSVPSHEQTWPHFFLRGIKHLVVGWDYLRNGLRRVTLKWPLVLWASMKITNNGTRSLDSGGTRRNHGRSMECSRRRYISGRKKLAKPMMRRNTERWMATGSTMRVSHPSLWSPHSSKASAGQLSFPSPLSVQNLVRVSCPSLWSPHSSKASAGQLSFPSPLSVQNLVFHGTTVYNDSHLFILSFSPLSSYHPFTLSWMTSPSCSCYLTTHHDIIKRARAPSGCGMPEHFRHYRVAVRSASERRSHAQNGMTPTSEPCPGM